MITRYVKVIGRVQGIGYRRWAEREAQKLSLWGWVRNVSDGSVELMVKGEEQGVNRFLAACLEGPAFAQVLGVQPVVIPYAAPEPVQEGIFKIVASV